MRFFTFIFMLLPLVPVQAQYQVFTEEQVVEEKDQRKARRKAIDQAIEAVTLEQVKSMIGENRYMENKTKVDKDIVALKNRFIPFFKILKSNKESEETYRFEIEVKVSQKDLRYVLQQKGLFSSQQKTGITLPFIEVNNRMNNESYRWWSPVLSTKKDLENLSLSFERELFQGFLDKGLFMLRPQAFSMVHMVPDALRKTFLTQTEMVQLTSYKRGQLYIDGRVDILSSPLRENAFRVRVQLSCKQASNGKSVAEVVRSYDTPSGRLFVQLNTDIKRMAVESGRDIASQVYDLWQRGALEAQVLQLAVTGNHNHQQLQNFKASFSQNITGVTELRERLFEPGRVTYELDYNGGVESLKTKLSQARFEGFISQVVSTNAEQIILDVKAIQ
ncbi:MAG: hypothetical protein HRT44_04640 [Bdellovibrionales bacterium]|nr:hypothetical protein [Bdellovibrionales bacterium]NQZ18530.1 hypothetical protein [Bdellovibrionales bacterium]